MSNVICVADCENYFGSYDIGNKRYQYQLVEDTESRFVFSHTHTQFTEKVVVNKNNLITWVYKYV